MEKRERSCLKMNFLDAITGMELQLRALFRLAVHCIFIYERIDIVAMNKQMACQFDRYTAYNFQREKLLGELFCSVAASIHCMRRKKGKNEVMLLITWIARYVKWNGVKLRAVSVWMIERRHANFILISVSIIRLSVFSYLLCGNSPNSVRARPSI